MENLAKGRKGIQSNWNLKNGEKSTEPKLKNYSKEFELGNTTGTQII